MTLGRSTVSSFALGLLSFSGRMKLGRIKYDQVVGCRFNSGRLQPSISQGWTRIEFEFVPFCLRFIR